MVSNCASLVNSRHADRFAIAFGSANWRDMSSSPRRESHCPAPGSQAEPTTAGPPSALRTGLLYVTGKIAAQSVSVKPVGDTIKPGPKVAGYFGSIEKQGETGMTTTVAVAGYDPASGQQAWYAQVPGTTNTGNLVTGCCRSSGAMSCLHSARHRPEREPVPAISGSCGFSGVAECTTSPPPRPLLQGGTRPTVSLPSDVDRVPLAQVSRRENAHIGTGRSVRDARARLPCA